MRLMIWVLAHNGRGGMTPFDGELVLGFVHADNMVGTELDVFLWWLSSVRTQELCRVHDDDLTSVR